jgi:hypothetical protein
MPYQVTCPAGTSFSVLKAVGEMKDDDGNFRFYDHESVVRSRGDILDDSDVSPVVRELLDKGDPKNPSVVHLHANLRKITAAQAKKLAAKPTGGLDDDIAIEVPDDDDPIVSQLKSRPSGQFGQGA